MTPPGRPGSRPGQHRPARVRVTSPRMGTARRPVPRSPASEIDAQTRLGQVYVASLLRTQLRQALTVIALTGLTLGTLPLLFATRPQLSAVRVFGLPLTWLVIGVSLYPMLVAAGWWLDRSANRAERDFAEIVSRS